jgi:hypothetical protein
VLDLLAGLLTFSPAKRLTAAAALEHRYFATVREPANETTASELFDFSFESRTDLDDRDVIKGLVYAEVGAPALARVRVCAGGCSPAHARQYLPDQRFSRR